MVGEDACTEFVVESYLNLASSRVTGWKKKDEAVVRGGGFCSQSEVSRLGSRYPSPMVELEVRARIYMLFQIVIDTSIPYRKPSANPRRKTAAARLNRDRHFSGVAALIAQNKVYIKIYSFT